MNLDLICAIPHVRGGRSYVGADCYGVLRLAFCEMTGVTLPEWGETIAGDVGSEAGSIVAALTSGEWVEISGPLKRADGVLLNVRSVLDDGSRVRARNHVGIIVPDGRLLHSTERNGVACVPLDHPTVKTDIAGFYRHRSQL